MRPLTLRNVLVATDLSEAMGPALRTAADLARLAGASLHVIHAMPELDDRGEHALKEHLQAAELGHTLSGARVEVGPADRVVAEEAQRTAADVIVLGPHRPDPRGELGSTAGRVVAAAEVPCLVLPIALSLPLSSILAPVDASEAARGALAVALTWASALRRRPSAGSEPTRLLAFHAMSGGDGAVDGAQLVEQEVRAVRDRLANVAGVEVQRIVERDDDPAGAILRHAPQFDLVVLGTTGRAETRGTRMGSVSLAVVCGASIPVLLVPRSVWRDHGSELPL